MVGVVFVSATSRVVGGRFSIALGLPQQMRSGAARTIERWRMEEAGPDLASDTNVGT